jgi:hypothetical protein
LGSKSYLQQFLEVLDQEGSQQEVFIRACDLLHAVAGSEYSRIVRACHLDIGKALASLDQLAGWKIIDPGELPISAGVRDRCLEFVDPDFPQELSSQVVPQLLLRAAPASLTQIRKALSTRVITPSPTMVIGIAESVRRITEAVPLATALPAERWRLRWLEPVDIPQSRFWSQTIGALRFHLSLDRPLRGDCVDSFDLLRAALGRGADLRISSWFDGLGLGYIERGRIRTGEVLSDDDSLGLRASQPVFQILNTLKQMAAISNIAPNADRVILASLLVEDSGLCRHIRSLFGASLNLPLLYLRSGAPQGLGKQEADWIVAMGDRPATPGPSAVAGDVDSARLRRLWTVAQFSPGFDADLRLAIYINNTGPSLAIGPNVPDAPLRTGDALTMQGLLDVIRDHQSNAADAEATASAFRKSSRADLDKVRDLEMRRGHDSLWGYTQFAALLDGDVPARLEARKRLAWSQPGPASLQALGWLGGAPSVDELDRLWTSDPVLAFEAVAVSHALSNGVRPYVVPADAAVARLYVGGVGGTYMAGLLTSDGVFKSTFELDREAAIQSWADIRSALSAGPADTRAALRSLASRIGLDEWSRQLDDARIEVTAMAPFGNFLLDQAVRAVSRPRSVLHRVFGGGPGRWQGSFTALQRAGGDRFVVADPTASLTVATAEAEAVAAALDAQLIGGTQVLRATVMRTLQASDRRPQILHFAGHGQSNLVREDGKITSGVIAADGEAVTIDAMTGVAVPRLVVASACDVGAVPPVEEAVGWSTAALARGAAYAVAAGLPVSDTGATVFMMLTYCGWRSGMHLESAIARTTLMGGNPSQMKSAWLADVQDSGIRKIGMNWLSGHSAAEIEFEMGLFLLSSL